MKQTSTHWGYFQLHAKEPRGALAIKAWVKTSVDYDEIEIVS
jgi:hypothetical protein